MSFLFGKNNRWAMLDKMFLSMFVTFSLIAGLSVDYIRGLAPSFPAFVLSYIASSACQLDSGRKRVARSVFVCVVSNALFDIIAIALNTGVFGIAIATTLSTYMQDDERLVLDGGAVRVYPHPVHRLYRTEQQAVFPRFVRAAYKFSVLGLVPLIGVEPIRILLHWILSCKK